MSDLLTLLGATSPSWGARLEHEIVMASPLLIGMVIAWFLLWRSGSPNRRPLRGTEK